MTAAEGNEWTGCDEEWPMLQRKQRERERESSKGNWARKGGALWRSSGGGNLLQREMIPMRQY